MRVQLNDNVYDVPDHLADKSDDEIAAFISSQGQAKKDPSFGTYLSGALQSGGAKLFETTGNIANLVGLTGVEKIARAREAEAKSFKDYRATNPEVPGSTPPTSTLGQLAYGLAEFAPQLPLYAAGEGAAMLALKGAGKVLPSVAGRVATAIPTKLAAVKGEGIIAGTARAVGRGALSGGVVGTAGATPGSTLEERAKSGYEEAKGFAVGVGILHPAFSVLRKAVGMALGKSAARVRNDADVARAMEDESFRAKIAEDADLSNALKEYETVRDTQHEVAKDYTNRRWFRDTTGKEEPIGFGLEDTSKPAPVTEAGKPAPSDQSLVKANVPESFKNTEAAIEFGGRATPEDIATLEQKLHDGQKLVAEQKPAAMAAMKAGDMAPLDALQKQAVQNQFASEAIQAARGAPRYGGESAQVPGVPVEPAPVVPTPKLPKAQQPLDPSKKLGMKFVPDDVGRDLANAGATRAEVQAIVDGVVKKPMTDLAVRRELANRGHDVEGLKKLASDKKREMLDRELVEEALDAEIERRGQGLTPEQRVAPVATTPALDAQARAHMEMKRNFEAKVAKLRKNGMSVEELKAMTPEQVHSKFNETLAKDAADAVHELTKKRAASDTKGLEKVDQVLEDAKALELDGDLAPSRLELLQLKNIERKIAKRDAEASAPAVVEQTRRQKRMSDEAMDEEVQSWLDDTSLDLKEPTVETPIPNAPSVEKPPPVELKTAEDYEALLKSEGMGADLPGGEDGFTMDFMGLQQMYEMARDIFKREINKDTLSLVGRGLMLEGPKDFPAFKKRMEEIAGPAWPAVKGNIGDLFEQSKAWHTDLTTRGVLTYHGTKVFFMPNERGEIGFDPKHAQPVREYTLDSLGLQQTYEGLRDMVRKGRLHPAVYPQGIQKLMGDLASGLRVKTVLDIFGGTGRIGKIKEYGYDGKVIANELEPAWGGVRTADLHKTNGVDVSIIGDARKIDLPNESVGAIMTSPTYGNEMARTGASRTESYQAFAGGELKEGNTGGMIWGPEYEALHKDAYKEAFRVVEPGGYFVLNMKDRFKSDRIPKANSTIAVEGGVMKATDWHTKALEAEGFKFVKQYRVEEGFATSAAHEVKRRNTVGYEDVVVLQKPVADGPSPYGSGVTFDFLGGQQTTEALYKLYRRTRDGKTTLGSDKLKEAILGADGKAWLHDRLPDPDAIRVWETALRQPMRIAEKIGGKAYDWVTKWNMAELLSAHKYGSAGGDKDVLNAIFAQLSKPERMELGRVVENKTKPSSEKVAIAAGQMRDWLDMMWDEKVASTRADYKSHLDPVEYDALTQVIDKGYDPGVVFAKFEKKDARVLQGLVDDYRSLEKKHIPDYMTHFERGSIVLRDKEVGGKVVAVALSPADAIRKAQRMKEANPNTELWMDTNFMKDMPQGVGQGQYFSVIKRLAENNDKILKELNEGVAKGDSTLAAKRAVRGLFIIKPTYKFSPFEMRRFGTLAGEEDVSSVLFNYAYTMRKKTALDPLIAEARELINREYAGQPNTQEFLRNLIDDTKGKYSWQDKAADDLIRWVGRETGIESLETASMSATKGAAYARAAEGMIKLAYRPVAAAFNYLGGQGNVWAQNGTKYFSAGYKFLASAEGKKFIKEMEPIMGQTFAHEGEVMKPRHEAFKNMPWWTQPMGLFEAPEIPNRSIGLAAPYLMARDSVKNGGLGMGEAEARVYAFRQNVFSQATYNIANLPQIMRSPIGKTVGQFKTYMINQIEFMTHLSAPEFGRYAIVQLALGGPRGAVAMLKSVPVLAMFGFWGDLEQWMDQNYPKWSRGIGGGLGIDVTGPAALQVPQTMTDWAGPFLSDMVKTYNNVLKQYMAGEKMMPQTGKEGVEFASSVAEQVSPLMKTWPKLLIDKMANPTQSGYIIKDQRGREIYRLENVDIAKVVMGAEPLESARIKQFESREKQHNAQLSKRKAYVTDAVVDALNAGEPVPPHIWEEMVKMGIQPGTLRREMKMRALSPEARRIIQTELARRGEIAEMYPKALQD